MGVSLLGPVAIDGGSDTLAPRDRVVLAALAMSPREVVTPDRLADALWADDPPATWSKVVQGSMVRIRKALGSGAVRTVSQGYVLDLPDDAIDALRFEELFRRGRELLALHEPDRARYALTQALDLWYGPALADLEGWSPGEAAAGRWEELRQDAEELRVEAALAAGGWREVLTEAGRLVADQPYRENRWALLARAQYQAGRQGEALATLQRARAVLAGELGLDPGPELAALEQSILHQDLRLLPTPDAAQTSVACPYRGLLTYDVDDAERFFGRDVDVQACLDVLTREHVVAVVGPSGSGKSSLVRAGVAARLRHEGRSVTVMTPGPRPVVALERAGGLRRGGVLVVDQLEEVVTLCDDAGERATFLATLAGHAEAGTDLVLTLRADRLGPLSGYPSFARTLERGLHLLGAMGEDDLRSAVEGPARQAGLLLEPGLVDLLVHEVSGEPGALPLLSHALVQTWERREGRTLTVDGYRASGGIQGAVARSAEEVFLGLDDVEKRAARALLLRLVVRVSSGEPTRSRVPRRALAADSSHEEIVEMLVAARLVTSDGESVELAHESLARAWPRLRGWLDADAEGQLILRHLTVAADSWAAMGRPDSELYRGTRLAQALEWHASTSADLTRTERDFLDASETLARAEARSAEERLHEQARSNRRLRGLLAGVVAMLAVALVAGALALRESNRADTQAGVAADQASLATVRELAAASRAAIAEDPQLAVLLALEATAPGVAGAEPVRQAVEALHAAVISSRVDTVFEGRGGSVSYSPDGRFLAHEGQEDTGLVEVIDLATGELALSFPGHDIDVNQVAFGPTGQLATVGDDGALRIWGAESEDLVHELTGEGVVFSPSFSTRGPERFAAVWPDQAVVRVATVGGDGSASVTPLRFGDWVGETHLSPDGRSLAVMVDERAGAVIADASTGEVRHELAGHGSPLQTLGVSPDGRWVVTAAEDGSVQIHDAVTGRSVHRFTDAESAILAVAWSPDARQMAVSEVEGDVRLYDVTPGAVRPNLHLPGGASLPLSLDFSPDGTRLVAGDLAIATATVWDIGITGDAEVMNARGATGAHGVAFGPEGRLFAVGKGASVAVYDDRGGDDPASRLRAPGVAARTESPFRSLGISPDGGAVGIAHSGSGAVVWDTAEGERLFATPAAPAPEGYRTRPSFGADGEPAVVSSAQAVEVYSLDGEVAARLPAPAKHGFRDAVLSPDGDLVAVLQYRIGRTVRAGLPNDPLIVNTGITPRPVSMEVVWWDWRSDEVLRTTPAPTGHDPRFSPDGSLLAIPHVGGPTPLIDVASGEVAFELEGHPAGVIDVAFSPDGSRIASGGLEGSTIVSDAADGSPLLELPASESEVSSVAFSPDGRHLATDSIGDDVVRVWTLDMAELREIAADQVARDLTAAECRQYLHRACGAG